MSAEIMVVDDEVNIRKTLQRMHDMEGYGVLAPAIAHENFGIGLGDPDRRGAGFWQNLFELGQSLGMTLAARQQHRVVKLVQRPQRLAFMQERDRRIELFHAAVAEKRPGFDERCCKRDDALLADIAEFARDRIESLGFHLLQRQKQLGILVGLVGFLLLQRPSFLEGCLVTRIGEVKEKDLAT